MSQKEINKQTFERLERLEKVIFGKPRSKHFKKITQKDFSGATGGIRFLISKGFFKKKRDLTEARKELADNDYHYSRQAIHEALKLCSKSKGSLVTLKEGGRKLYVERK